MAQDPHHDYPVTGRRPAWLGTLLDGSLLGPENVLRVGAPLGSGPTPRLTDHRKAPRLARDSSGRLSAEPRDRLTCQRPAWLGTHVEIIRLSDYREAPRMARDSPRRSPAWPRARRVPRWRPVWRRPRQRSDYRHCASRLARFRDQ